jgi:hypothetical protein
VKVRCATIQNYKCAPFETWGVGAEVKRWGGENNWYVEATTGELAAGREELRKALAEIVRKAVENGWIDEKKAEGWLEKLEGVWRCGRGRSSKWGYRGAARWR